MAFVVDALGSWLVEQVASSVTRRLGKRLLGSEQERALHAVGRTAIHHAAAQLAPDDADHVAMVVTEVFAAELPVNQGGTGHSVRHATVLEAVCAGMAARLAVLGDTTITGIGVSSAEALGIPVERLTQTLITQVLEQIRLEALGGGPLEPLARQLNDDATHLQLRDHTRLGLRSAAALEQLIEQVHGLSALMLPAAAVAWTDPAAATAVDSFRWPRVDACDPRRLGVHSSITLPAPGVATPSLVPGRPAADLAELPAYVRRDVDEQLRDAIREAAGRGGLVVVVGGSSTGKTRTAYQALREELPDWPLWHPADADQVAAAVSGGQLLRGRVVVWLDEAQHYLSNPDGLSVGTVRDLLDADQPVVVVATLWPSWYEQFTTMPPPPSSSGGDDPEPLVDPVWHTRQILTTLAHVVRLGDFTPAERDRAKQLADADPRWQIALGDADFGPTQVLAGAPQLIDRWMHATNPYAKALMSAAIDFRRLGYMAPLAADLLRDAVRGYLSSRLVATTPPGWFTTAIAYAAEPLNGATSALIPVPGPSMGSLAGYTVADYLLQHGQATLRAIPAPGSVWDAAVTHIAHIGDRVQFAGQARARSLYRHAELLITPAAETGDLNEMKRLVEWLEQAGRTQDAEAWRRRAAETGSPEAMRALARWLEDAERPQEAEDWWRRAAETGDLAAMWGLARWLEDSERTQDAEEWWRRIELRFRRAAETGSPQAMRALARLRPQRAEEWWRRAAETGDLSASAWLAEWLQEAGRTQEAEDWWRRAAEGGHLPAMWALVRLLEGSGRVQEAQEWRRQVAQAGQSTAMGGPVEMLGEAERIQDAEEWRRQAAQSGHPTAMWQLAWWLEAAGRAQEAEDWRRRAAETGDLPAMERLAWWLEAAGRAQEAEEWRRRVVEEWRRRATETTDPSAMWRLAEWLERAGLDQEAEEWRRCAGETGDADAMERLAQWLEDAERPQEAEEWRRRAAETRRRQAAETGDLTAMWRLAQWLEEAGRGQEAEEWRRRAVETGNPDAMERLAQWLEEAGRAEEADRLRRFGIEPGGLTAAP